MQGRDATGVRVMTVGDEGKVAAVTRVLGTDEASDRHPRATPAFSTSGIQQSGTETGPVDESSDVVVPGSDERGSALLVSTVALAMAAVLAIGLVRIGDAAAEHARADATADIVALASVTGGRDPGRTGGGTPTGATVVAVDAAGVRSTSRSRSQVGAGDADPRPPPGRVAHVHGGNANGRREPSVGYAT